ncbi:MAG: glycoside hydrolase family 3 N-terminal domain-containing protein, partial [Firmicutes bacterium]|nr:glycoside hydrolase family 3 N-terminal domain-containing protein [Bacillota bacterium]
MDFRKRAEELVGKMTLSEKISQISYDSPAIDRLGIPAYNWWNECLHGLARAGTATVFPQAIGMAASFNDTLLEEVADAVSDEARAKYNDYKKMEDRRIHYGNSVIKTKQYRCLTMFTPNINIFRDPRWGRGHETYGEDPYLTGRMGAAYVRGLQGYGEYHKVDATIKHYAVHSGPEKLRHGFDAGVSDEDLYNTYLKAFEYCIKYSDPASVMSAYNAVHGVPCSSSKELLCDILRGKFGFKGYVVSDCGAVTDIYFGHKKVNSISEAAA